MGFLYKKILHNSDNNEVVHVIFLTKIGCTYRFIPLSISNLQEIWYTHFNIYLNKPGIFRLYIAESYEPRLGMLRANTKDLISETLVGIFFVTIASHL